jgi:hypothetical protein
MNCAFDWEMRLGDLDGHLEVAGKRDLLRTAEGGCAEAGGAANDGAEGCAFAAAEERAHQGSCARAKTGADQRRSSFGGREDGAFDAEGFVRRGVVDLDDLGVDAGGASVEHDEAVELENHLGAALETAGHVDGADVPVDAGSLVCTLRDDGCAEGIVDLGVGAGEGVVEVDAEGDVLGNGERWRGGQRWEGNEDEEEGDDDAGVFETGEDEVQRIPFLFPDGRLMRMESSSAMYGGVSIGMVALKTHVEGPDLGHPFCGLDRKAYARG